MRAKIFQPKSGPHRTRQVTAVPLRSSTPLQVRQILHGPHLQPKLTVGPPDDAYEREADQVADAVMRMPEPEGRVQRVCAECAEEMQRQPVPDEDEEEKKVQAKEAPGQVPEVAPDLESRITALRGGGQPLPFSERAFFEPRFGQDFSGVRLHTGSAPAEIAQVLHARAFTTGNHIVFGSGQYEPGSGEGKRLLAHELTHVVQQGGEGAGQRVAQPMIQMARDCDQEQIACFRRCWRRKPPWPIDKGSRGHYAYCSASCLAQYMECIGENAAERAFDSMSEAMEWLGEHPEVVVGALVVVAGVTFVVATGGSGALILVPAAL